MKKIRLPAELESLCDSVASCYLRDKDGTLPKLMNDSPDFAQNMKYFKDRQELIDNLKVMARIDESVKPALDQELWGTATVREIWRDRAFSTLHTDLLMAFGGNGPWSLQLLPESLEGVGHHMALGRSPNGINYWLLDTATCMLYFFNGGGDAAQFTYELLLETNAFKPGARTVLLEITPLG